MLEIDRLSQLEDNLSAMDANAKLRPEIFERIDTIVANKPTNAERFA